MSASVTRLGEIAEFVMGQAPPGSASNFEGRGTIFVKAGEFGSTHPIIREWTTKPLKFAKAGDVLICVVGATAGKLNLGIDCAIGRSVAAIRPCSKTFDKFIYLQLLPKVLDLRAGSTGSAQGVISKDMLANIEINLPSLDEQHQVVAEIEKQFTRLDAGVAALKRVQANLKRYRASVLKAACEGKLVPTEAELARAEGRTYEPADQLLSRILTERRKKWNGKGKYKEPAAPEPLTNSDLPKGWVWTGFDQISENSKHAIKAGPFGSALKKSFYAPSGYKIYGQEQVINNDPYNGDYCIPLKLYEELKSCAIKPGDILVSLVGTTGKVLILPDDCEPGIINPRLLKLSLNPEIVATKFIKILLEAPQTRSFFKIEAHGGTMEILNLGILKSLPIALPPFAEQMRIIAEVERRLSVVEELEAVVEANLQRATRLRQAVLQKAFCGKL